MMNGELFSRSYGEGGDAVRAEVQAEAEKLRDFTSSSSDVEAVFNLFTQPPVDGIRERCSELWWVKFGGNYMLQLGPSSYFIIHRRGPGQGELWRMPSLPAARELVKVRESSNAKALFRSADEHLRISDENRWKLLNGHEREWQSNVLTQRQRTDLTTKVADFYQPQVIIERARINGMTSGQAAIALNVGQCIRNAYWDGPPYPDQVKRLKRLGLGIPNSQRAATNLLDRYK